MSTKLCACGKTAWFGNYCHECRDRLLDAVSVRGQQRPIKSEHQATAAHHNLRKPMSPQAANNYGKGEGEE